MPGTKLHVCEDRDKLEQSASSLKEGMELLVMQQKRIKIADTCSSKLGWKVVAVYEVDELAVDSNEEKKLHM